MFNRYAAVAVAFATVAGTSAAIASPCGEKAASMLRFYNTSLSTPSNPTMTGGGASTNSARPNALPVTTSQQQKASVLVQKAVSEDKAGDMSGCQTDLAAANSIVKYNQ